MGALTFIIGGYALIFGSYFFFRKPVERLIPPDKNRETAAHQIKDNPDYEPLPTSVAFGHYFMSIAGLSPILSAIVGMYWGWVPAIIWLLLGVIWMGTPTEYINLMTSTRNKGKTLGELIIETLGKTCGNYMSLVLAIAGILTYAIFMSVMAKTLVNVPQAAIPTAALTVIAIIFGWLRKTKGYSLAPATAISLLLWSLTIFWGYMNPVSLSYNTWIAIFVIYVFAASYFPVWLIVAPRDYLNSGILLLGLSIATIALIIGAPKLIFPAWVGFESMRGHLWPVMLVTITCGAVNGLHCMISAGSTSKQLDNEKNAYTIVGLGTRGETVMAVICIALIAASATYDNFLKTVATDPGGAFSNAFGNAMTYLGLPVTVGLTIGALTLTAFTITTMDTYARTGRYSWQEFGQHFDFIKSIGLSSRFGATLFVVIVGLLLALYTPFMQLWSGFAMISLVTVVYPYFIMILNRVKSGEKFSSHFIGWVIIPCAFFYVSTWAAMLYMISKWVTSAQWIPICATLVLIVLFLLSSIQVYKKYQEFKGESEDESKLLN